MKKILSYAIVFLLVFSCSAHATEITPRADALFLSATPALNTDQSVTFSAVTYDIHSLLSVLAVWLEQKIEGEWEYVCALPNPSGAATNAYVLTVMMDYSSEIGTGTFRVWATFNADGYEITRCSNERTFN